MSEAYGPGFGERSSADLGFDRVDEWDDDDDDDERDAEVVQGARLVSEPEPEPAAPAGKSDLELLAEIRDLLAAILAALKPR